MGRLTYPARPASAALTSDRLLVTAFCALIAVVVVASLPFRYEPLGYAAPFLQAYGVALGAAEVLTALVLGWRARLLGSRRMGVLAAAYAFSVPLVLGNLLAVTQVFGAADAFQGAAWIWIAWHLGWAALVAVFAASPERRDAHPSRVPLAAFGVAALVIVVALTSARRLPALVVQGVFTPLNTAMSAAIVAVALLAVLLLARRWRTLTNLELWVLVAAFALASETGVSSVSGGRFTVGYYLARVLIVVSTATVLVSMTGELMRLVKRSDLLAVYEASDRRFRTLLDTVPQIVWTADATGWIEWYNARWYEYTGQTPEEAAGWGWQAAHHPDDFPDVMRRWPEAIASGRPTELEFRLRRRDGAFEWFLTRVVPQRDEQGDVQRWFGSCTNIDAQKREAVRSARIAQIMQEAFLPESFPSRPDLRFDALYLPAESDALVGGDWYDAVTLPDGRILVSCGDVAGHGLDAAMLAARYRQSIAFGAFEDPEPARVLTRVNRVALLQDGGLASAVVAIADLDAGVLRYAIAGHPPPVVASAAGARVLAYGGVPLGVSEDAAFETRQAALTPETVVLFYTDGVSEFARDPVAAEGALVLAARHVLEHPTERAAESVKRLVLGDAPPRDDAAILVLQRRAAPPASPDATQPAGKSWRFHSSDPLTARNARVALTAFLAPHAEDGDEALFAAELVIGEAIANTVEHAPGLVEASIDWSGERPVLTIRDAGPGFSAPGDAPLPHPMSEDGRGLFLIRTLADDVTLENAPGFGTQLRCTLRLTRRAERAAEEPTAGRAAPEPGTPGTRRTST